MFNVAPLRARRVGMRSAASALVGFLIALAACGDTGSASPGHHDTRSRVEDASVPVVPTEVMAVPDASTPPEEGDRVDAATTWTLPDGSSSIGEIGTGPEDAGWPRAEGGLSVLGCLGLPDQACLCADGGVGWQTCSPGGVSGPCLCETTDAGPVSGTVTTLYVHGRSDSTPVDWGYWAGQARPGVNAVAVNWAGNDRIGNTNFTIREALDTYCTGENWCYIACHSAGCAQVGYALDLYGVTGDVESWNIYWVAAAGSAAGGSEVADLKLWSNHHPIDEDLKTIAMRNSYDHDDTAGVTHYMLAGAGYSDAYVELNAFSAQLPGSDDAAVAYHSSCGIRNSAFNVERFWCNAGEICSGEYVDPTSQESLWLLHAIYFLDKGQLYSHYIADSNEGICHELFSLMETYAL